MHLAAIMIAVSLALPQTPDTLSAAVAVESLGSAHEASVPVQSVTSLQMARTGAVSLQDALRSFSGVNIRDYGGEGGLKTVDVRSFGAQHTAVCYDGMVISNAQNGTVDIGRFGLEDIESVKLETGGSDDIFRPARLAASMGVLSVSNARPQFDSCGTVASVRMRVSSLGTISPAVSVRQRIGSAWAMTARAEYLSTPGDYPFLLRNGELVTKEKRLNSDVQTFSGEANLFGDLGSAGDLSVKMSWLAGERGLPGSVVLYTQNPTERLWDRDLRLSALYVGRAGKALRYRAQLGWDCSSNRYLDSNPSLPAPEDDRYRQQEFASSFSALWAASDVLSFSASEDLAVNTLWTSLADCPFPVRESSYTAISGKYSGSRLTAVATLLATVMAEQLRQGENPPLRSRLSPSISASYRLLEDHALLLRASYREGFRMPTFNDLYYSRVGNRELEPEKSRQINLGLSWEEHWRKGNSASLSVDGYAGKVRDKIVAIPTMFIWRMRNVGVVSLSGVEITASGTLAASSWLRLRATASYSLQNALNVTSPDAKNYRHQIAYVPRNSGNGSLTLVTPWLNVGYVVTAVGRRWSLDQNLPAYAIDPYTDHSISLNRDLKLGTKGRLLHVSADALNLGGKNYEIIKYYPMPGRQFRLTIRFTI
ncbi:MAG: TonB-dependent receptor [Bacteroidales bacterium]|nr:TonB-dependent receptor [Bacteroidales bacterium]